MRRLLLLVLLVACSKDKAATSAAWDGTYEDWDSYDDARVYVKDPVITTDRARGTVRYEADGYFPTVVTVNPKAKLRYQARGMLLSRIARFYVQLRTTGWDPTTALALIEVRREPGGDPIEGVSISVNAAKGYRHNANDSWEPSATTGEGSAYVAFPNLIVGGGLAKLDVRASGLDCQAPATIAIAAGEVAYALVTCARRR